MTGLSGGDGHLRRLQIADLADHDDVRILPQQSADAGGHCRQASASCRSSSFRAADLAASFVARPDSAQIRRGS